MTDGASTWNYVYDGNNMRISRSNGTQTYSYVYNGSQLTQMTVGSNTLNFAYDASGMPMMVTYNGTNYYYIVNLQGDVMGIVDSTGIIVVNYTYDAWGKPLSITGSMADTLGTLNPLRYRGYVYDQETTLYYVCSRYYNPEIGRWISPEPNVYYGEFDEGAGLLGYNVYAYCANNPVMFKDETGEGIVLTCILIFGAIGAAAGGYAGYKLAQYYGVGKGESWKYVLGGVVIGGAAGAMIGWGVGGLASFAAAKSASTALFAGRVAKNGPMVIQLLKKFYEKAKVPMNVRQVKQLITLCKRFGIEIQAKLGDLVNVVNHKSWNGISHIHVGDSRIHVALTAEAVEYIRKILGI